MASKHVVVNGSNIATEGRSMPSLAQLDQAVREFMGENPDDVVTVVVNASFGHRIDLSEVKMFEEAEAAGELVSPPAGAIGRGDAFLLRIADKTGATVLSNDSFQEFHGEHTWLFDKGRLIGGKPVPGVGWIFTPRTPVRGPKSREAVKEAKRTKKGEPEPVVSAIPGLDLAAERSRGKGKGKKTVERAIAVATEEAVEPGASKRRRRRGKGGTPPAEPLNEPLAFITFIAAHPLGSEVDGVVESFASHGAFIEAEGTRCYLPLSAMGDPPPRSGREVFARGEAKRFVVQALDPQRRGIELALPGFVRVAGTPTDETVEAEIAGEARLDVTPVRRRRQPSRASADALAPAPPAEAGETAGPAERVEPVEPPPPARRRRTAAAAPPAASPPPEPAPVPTRPRKSRAGAKAAAEVAAAQLGQPAEPAPAVSARRPRKSAARDTGGPAGAGAGASPEAEPEPEKRPAARARRSTMRPAAPGRDAPGRGVEGATAEPAPADAAGATRAGGRTPGRGTKAAARAGAEALEPEAQPAVAKKRAAGAASGAPSEPAPAPTRSRGRAGSATASSGAKAPADAVGTGAGRAPTRRAARTARPDASGTAPAEVPPAELSPGELSPAELSPAKVPPAKASRAKASRAKASAAKVPADKATPAKVPAAKAAAAATGAAALAATPAKASGRARAARGSARPAGPAESGGTASGDASPVPPAEPVRKRAPARTARGPARPAAAPAGPGGPGPGD